MVKHEPERDMSKLPRLRSENVERLGGRGVKIDKVKLNKANEVEQISITTRKHVPGTRKHVPGTEPEEKLSLEIAQARGEHTLTLEGQAGRRISNPEVIAVKRRR